MSILKNLTEGCFPRYFYYEEAYVLLGGVAKMLVNTFRVFVFMIYVPWESDPGEEVMSVLVWECQEGLLERRPSSCGSPMPGERKGSPRKGRGSQYAPGKRPDCLWPWLWPWLWPITVSSTHSHQQEVQMLRNAGSSVAWGRTRSPRLPPCAAVCQTLLCCPSPPAPDSARVSSSPQPPPLKIVLALEALTTPDHRRLLFLGFHS